MGAGIIGSGLGSADCLVGGFGNAGEHTAGGTCDGSGVEAGRQGITLEIRVPFTTAVLGGKVEVQTLL